MNASFFQCTIPIGNPRPAAAGDGGSAAASARPRILPVFMPFAGCPHRCLFCAQDKQTGASPEPPGGSALRTLASLLHSLKAKRQAAQDTFRPVEIAFYGGTFTALPETVQMACLARAAEGKKEGLVCRVRCSTRPDALTPRTLDALRAGGLDLVELGIQSFHTEALEVSQRGYTGETAREGCRLMQDSGLELGIQLLPGMPGSTPERFREDVRNALAFSPACLRFYPCLVVDGTPLATLWKKGAYGPWDTLTTVDALGGALAEAWERRIPVIRLSVAPEASFDAAAPAIPPLEASFRGKRFFRHCAGTLRQGAVPQLRLPCRASVRGFSSAIKKALSPDGKRSGSIPGPSAGPRGKTLSSGGKRPPSRRTPRQPEAAIRAQKGPLSALALYGRSGIILLLSASAERFSIPAA